MLKRNENTIVKHSNVVDVIYSSLAFALTDKNIESYQTIAQNLDLFFKTLTNFVSDPVLSFSNIEQTQDSLKLLICARDLLSICNEQSSPVIGRTVSETYLKKLHLSKSLNHLCGCLCKVKDVANQLVGDKKPTEEMNPSEKLDYLNMLQNLLSQIIFQYLNATLDTIVEDDLKKILKMVKSDEFSKNVSFLLILSLVSYADKCRKDIFVLESAHDWKCMELRNALAFGNYCVLGNESKCENFIDESSLDFYQSQIAIIIDEISKKKQAVYRIFLNVVKITFKKLILNLSHLLRKIRTEEEREESHRKGIFEKILSILSLTYSASPEDAIEFWEHDGLMSAFLRWCSTCLQPSCIRAFLDLLSTISEGAECSKLSFEMISNGALGIFSWNPFFDSLAKYSVILSESSHYSDINPDEFYILLSFLQLATVLSNQLPSCRDRLFQPQIINTLITLLCCRVPIEMKAKIISLLAAFSKDMSKATIIYSFLEKSQILNSLLCEIQQVESKQNSWLETLSFLDLCSSLIHVDSTVSSLVMDKIYVSISNREFLVSIQSLQVVQKCFEIFSESTNLHDIIQVFLSNSSCCTDFLLKIIGIEQVEFFESHTESYKRCVFYALKFIMIILNNDKRFIDVLFGRNTQLVKLFCFLEDFSNSSICIYILDILNIICSSGYLTKISQIFQGNEQIKNGFASILSIEGPMIHDNTLYPSQYDDDTDYSYLAKFKFLSIIKKCISSSECNNYFISIFQQSNVFSLVISDTIKNSPHSELIESCLEVLFNVLKYTNDSNETEAFLRFLRNDVNLFTYLIKSIPLVNSPLSHFTVKSFGFILRLLAYDILSLYQSKLSTSSLISEISFIDIDLLLKTSSNESFIMESFEFFLSIIVHCLNKSKCAVFESFVKDSLFNRLCQIIQCTNNMSICENATNCLFTCASLTSNNSVFFTQTHFDNICLLFTQSSKFNVQSRISLYSCLISLRTVTDSVEELALPIPVLNVIFSELFSQGTIQVLSIACLESYLNIDIVDQLYQNGYLNRLVKFLFIEGKNSTALLTAINYFFLAFAKIDPSRQAEAYDLLVDAGFVDLFALHASSLNDCFCIAANVASQCLLHVPRSASKGKLIHDNLFEFIGKQLAKISLTETRRNPKTRELDEVYSICSLVVGICSYNQELCSAYEPTIAKIYSNVFLSNDLIDENLLSFVLQFHENKVFKF